MSEKTETKPETTQDEEQSSFEDNLKQLEEIVAQLEQGEVALDEALELYEKGVAAYRSCHQRLDQAETKVTKLVETLEGDLKEEPFDVPQDTE
mgnify:CR=1 FL=1